MTPIEVDFVSQRIAAVALARGDRAEDQIVEKILAEVPEAKEDAVRKMVSLLQSILNEVKIAIPKIVKKRDDPAYPDLEKWKVQAFISQIMSAHSTFDKQALESLIDGAHYYDFLR